MFPLLLCSSPRKDPTAEKPNILFILVDDMGWSDLGCCGSEIRTPNIDSLAKDGVRFTQFYNTAKCNTSRACLLTGLYAQQCGMMSAKAIKNGVTRGEVLRPAGYRTLASGKHHGTETLMDRGFDHYYGLRDGCCNFWNPGTKRDGEPEPGRKSRVRFRCDDETTYHPYTPEDIAKYEGMYDEGCPAIREARYKRMVEMGLIDPEKNPLPEWTQQAWDALDDLERRKEIRRMEIYAAMLDRADQNIGRILSKLKAQGKFKNTLIFFASDNGGCPEEDINTKFKSTKLEDFGTVASYEAVEKNWATVQNTPLRKWKTYSHEGGSARR